MIKLGKINEIVIYIPSGYKNVEVVKKLTECISETDIKAVFSLPNHRMVADNLYVSIPDQGVIFRSDVALEVLEQYRVSYKQDQEKVITLSPEESKQFLQNVQNITNHAQQEQGQDIDFGAEDEEMIDFN